jgi:uncharacterized protein DUF3159
VHGVSGAEGADAQVQEPTAEPRTQQPGADERIDIRETVRQQMLSSIGGWTGSIIAAVPTVVFVIVNATVRLRPAIFAAVGTAVVLALYRMARRQSVQQAIGGLFGVIVAAAIAGGTGQARGYFLLGIYSSFAYAGVFAASILVRRPIVGVLWEFLDPSPGTPPAEEASEGAAPVPDSRPWHRSRVLLRGYVGATLIGTALFASRGAVQLALYKQNATGWLAFTKVAMGFPLYAVCVIAGFWVVTRARRQQAIER